MKNAFDPASGRNGLQRLFSTFPAGRPGIGLLLLRSVVALTAIAEGTLYLSGVPNPFWGSWLLGLVLFMGGASLLIGFLTPLAGLLLTIYFLGIAFSWFPRLSWTLPNGRLFGFGMIVVCVSLALLGPGAFSLDGRLFGRREIVIPPSRRPPEL